MSALGPLQVALVARLKGDAGVTALVGSRVYDGVAKPDPVTGAAPTLPWITVDTLTGVEEGAALGSVGFGHTVTVHAFASDAQGNKDAFAVAAAFKSALRLPLAIAGHASTRLKVDFETTLEELGKRHVPVRFRLIALEA